jgi:hypothetical protein
MRRKRATGTLAQFHGSLEQSKQSLGLIARGDGRAGPANGQNFIVSGWIRYAAHHEIAQIIVADWFTGGEFTVAKDQECLALRAAAEFDRTKI